MGVPFGFSVGDIIAGIGAIKVSIEAFSNTRGASKEYTLLSDKLTRLCESLELVRAIEVDPIHDAAQREAVRQAIKQCQTCIDDFLDRIVKFKGIQPSTQPRSWSEKLHGAARKIQWALCKQDDIRKFGADIQLRLEAISMLLVVFQIHRGSREAGLQEAHRQQDGIYRHVALETRDVGQKTFTLLDQQSSTLGSMATEQSEILSLSRNQLNTLQETEIICHTNHRYLKSQRNTLESIQTDNRQMLDRAGEQLAVAENTQEMVRELQNGMTGDQRAMLQQILQQQARNFQLILDQQSENHQLVINGLKAVSAQIQLQCNIPPQVLLQQPVIFKDALDRITPVHLEFIDSAEAFVAVLKIRFKDIGLEKLERNEFLLSDEKQNRDLDIRRPWQAVMKPGQHVSMRMVFDTGFQLNSCPGCLSENDAGRGQETICANCGLTYRLVEEKLAQLIDPRRAARRYDFQSDENRAPEGEGIHDMEWFDSANEATIADFRRVHLINRTTTYLYKCTFPDCENTFSTDTDRRAHELSDHLRDYTATMDGAGVSAPDDTSGISHEPPSIVDEQIEAVESMEAMGFERSQIEAAMRAASYNPDRAIEYLLMGIPENIQQENRLRSAPDLASGSPAGARAGSTSSTGNLSFLRNNPQFQQLRQVVQQQPNMLEPILQQVAAGNPQLAQLISEHPDEFLQLLGEDENSDAPIPPGSQAISVTEEERDAIERLCRLGFDRDQAIQAYFASDKNEELAANFLFDQPYDSD